jgi:prepilin-type N-terminal cleavage/methylation domain-containing protein
MNQRGITLLELIIVVVIIAIGAALTTPNIGGWLPNYRLRSAIRDIASTMRIAQMKAISNNLQYRVNLNAGDVGSNSYVLQRNSGGWIDDGAPQTLPPGIMIATNTLPNQRAEFNPNSMATVGNVTLSNTKGSIKTVRLLGLTGRIRVE